MNYKRILPILLVVLAIVAIFVVGWWYYQSNREVNNKNTSNMNIVRSNINEGLNYDNYFIDAGYRKSFDTIEIKKEGERNFYTAKTTANTKELTVLVDADQISEIIQKGKFPGASDSDRFLDAFYLRNLSDREFPFLEWLPSTWPEIDTVEFYKNCQNVDENCFLKQIKAAANHALAAEYNMWDTILKNPPNVSIDKVRVKSIDATLKQEFTPENCHEQTYYLIYYQQQWYLFNSVGLCIEY